MLIKETKKLLSLLDEGDTKTNQDQRFSQGCGGRFQAPGIQYSVDWYAHPDIWRSLQSLYSGFWDYTEDGGRKLLRNFGTYISIYTCPQNNPSLNNKFCTKLIKPTFMLHRFYGSAALLVLLLLFHTHIDCAMVKFLLRFSLTRTINVLWISLCKKDCTHSVLKK